MTRYDFKSLSPLDFEELVRDLLQSELDVRFESFAEGRDSGIDFRHCDSGRNWIVQVKHYAQSGLNALIRSMRHENRKVASLSPSRYILATSVSVSPDAKDRICREMPDTPLAKEDIFGREDLNNLIGRHREVEQRHFKLWLASTEVLRRILKSAVYARTELEMELIRKTTLRFVHNESMPEAEALLAKNHALIISGQPGVGKTTLARMLVWLHAEMGWQIHVIDDIRDAFEISSQGGKQLIFFDDFLGQIALSSDVLQSTDRRFLPFMQRVRANENLRFILTTREYILQQALSVSDRLDSDVVNASKLTLNLGFFTRAIRARILYNHLYFSDLSPDDLNAVLSEGFPLKIVDHPNFNPRLIERLTSSDYLAVAAGPVRTIIEQVLANPVLLWERPFREHISSEARLLLFALNFSGAAQVDIAGLGETFARILSISGSDVPAHERPPSSNGLSVKSKERSSKYIQKRSRFPILAFAITLPAPPIRILFFPSCWMR